MSPHLEAPAPTATRPTLKNLVTGCHGQDVEVLITGGPDGNAEGAKASLVKSVMEEGKRSAAHSYAKSDVFITVERCGRQGVLTLSGPDMHDETWLFKGYSMRIAPGNPHATIYPAATGPLGLWHKLVRLYCRITGAPDRTRLVTTEVRTSPTWDDADIIKELLLEPLVNAEIEDLGLRVDPTPEQSE
jgi:hypothetical protein